MLSALFMTGSVLFWCLVAIHFVVMLLLIENERPILATVSLIVCFGLLKYLGDFDLIQVTVAHPILTVVAVAAYFVAGTGWSIWKWWFFVRDCRKRYDDTKAQFLAQHGYTDKVACRTATIPNDLLKAWQEECANARGYSRRTRLTASNTAPKASEHKGRILTWMCYWPWSFVWTMIDDPVKRLFKQIYLQIQGLLQSISNRAFQGVESDFRPPPPSPPTAPTEDGNVTKDGSDEPPRTASSAKSVRNHQDRL